MISFNKIASKTKLMTKIAIPIIVLGITTGFFISNSISNLLDEYTTKSLKIESRNINNKIFYLVESEFKTLFFSYGRLQEDFIKAQKLSKQELIESLKSIFQESIYDIALITPQEVEWIKKEHRYDGVMKGLERSHQRTTYFADNHIISSAYFKPWQWQIVVFRDRSSLTELLKQNNAIITKSIAMLIILLILTLIVILYLTIDRPFNIIFGHLNKIKNNVMTPLMLSSSKEIVKLVNNINAMSAQILSNQNELKTQKEKIKRIMDIQPDILVVTNGHKIQSVNESFFKFFDAYHTLEEFLAQHDCVCDFFEEVDDESYIYDFDSENWVDVAYKTSELLKVKIKKKSHYFIFRVQVEKLDVSNYVVNLSDITQLEEYKEELESKQDSLITQLYTDSLTELPNRIKLIEDLKDLQSPMIILINIDGFKKINDFYGVDIGDYVLIEFAQIINQNLPSKSAKLYKMSGDEYIILDNNELNKTQLIQKLNRLSTALNTHSILKNEYEIDISTTLGISLSQQEPLITADVALHKAKNSKLRFAIYDKSFETLKEYQNNLLWSKKIKSAIDEHRIVPYFQPIVDNPTHQIVKYETLVRLISVDGEIVPPSKFLDIAKQSRIYHNISAIMIEESFRYFASNGIAFTINISISDIENFETYNLIMKQLQKYQLGNRVTFEILESEGIKNYDIVASFIHEIKKYGALVAIDDFGTGYSNFNHIINLRIDFLKIDGSLINNMLDDENSRMVVETIVTFAKKLDIKTIAEFVDSKELYEYVGEIGIDYSQGFYIAKPQKNILHEGYHFYD
ncbi:MAG: bifunctional diguanylate cyclase/phosphodiesterase [Campylobacterota bacterium]|nr:bifunctional diguanylate cyclase/phosphodiesterase [Campylobacterota bacterium]